MPRARKTTKKARPKKTTAQERARNAKKSRNCYHRKKERAAKLEKEITSLDEEIDSLISSCRKCFQEAVAFNEKGGFNPHKNEKFKEMVDINRQVENLASEFEQFNAVEDATPESADYDQTIAVVPGTSQMH